MLPDKRCGPTRLRHRLTLPTDVSIGAPNLLASLFVEGGDILLFFVVRQDNKKIPRECWRTSRTEVQIDWICFKGRVPGLLTFHVKRPHTQIRYVHINRLSICD